MISYSLTTMMCFKTKVRYGFSSYTVNLFPFYRKLKRVIGLRTKRINHIKALCPGFVVLFHGFVVLMCGWGCLGGAFVFTDDVCVCVCVLQKIKKTHSFVKIHNTTG